MLQTLTANQPLSPTLTISWHARTCDIPEPLWQACFPPPLEGRWWYQALEEGGLDDQFQFLYAVVSYGDTPIALAPCFVMDVPLEVITPDFLVPLAKFLGRFIPALRTERTLFIGSPCADEGTVGMVADLPVLRAQIFHALQEAFVVKAKDLQAPMLVWKDFAAHDEADLSALAKTFGLFRAISFPGTKLNFAAKDFSSYLKTLKATHRYQLRKKLKRSHAVLALEMEVITQPDDETLREIFALFLQTYEKGTTKFERLTFAVFASLAQEETSQFIVLRERETKIMRAFMLCFVMGDAVINKFIGLDYQTPKEWFLYFRLWEAVVTWALARRAKSIQSGQTGYRPKIEAGHVLLPLTNYARHSNPLINLIYAQVAKTITWASLDDDLATYVKAHSELVQIKRA